MCKSLMSQFAYRMVAPTTFSRFGQRAFMPRMAMMKVNTGTELIIEVHERWIVQATGNACPIHRHRCQRFRTHPIAGWIMHFQRPVLSLQLHYSIWKSWFRKFEQWDKWSFCQKAASMRTAQERP
jgi:hypothetical protein